MGNISKHFVTFVSPGTFVSEQSTIEIEAWDTDNACKMARGIIERHGATPYGFFFSTRDRGPEDLDSHRTKQSGLYFLGGKVLTLSDIKAKNDPNDFILISNMECNGWNEIVTNTNSYKITVPLKENDTVLDFAL